MSALSLTDHRPTPGPTDVAPLAEFRLAVGRVHELCGPARHTAAMLVAGAMAGPVFWVQPGWEVAHLSGDGIAPFMAPGRVTFVSPKRSEDVFWSTEEVLKAGCVPLVVADLPGPPGLTAVRRLHLAAEASGARPLGLILTPGDGGAPGVETRWHMAPRHSATKRGWHLQRRRARMAPEKAWDILHDKGVFRMTSSITAETTSQIEPN
ncbi:MAG: hypothetical protein AAFX00_10905 [Pseudomonadota bacterium]